MSASLLPSIARPPHDPLRFRLDRRAGWRTEPAAALTSGVEVAPGHGGLALAPLPGTGPSLADASGSFGGVTWPDHLAPLPGDGIVLLDRSRNALRRLDRCECRFRDWPCLGREARDRRRPADAVGIASGCGQLFLADRGEARVLVFGLAIGALRAEWPSPRVPGLARWQPEDVAIASTGAVIVSDAANGGLHVFSTYGHYRRFLGGLGAVRSLAIDRFDRVYVRVDAASHVLVVDLDTGEILERPSRPEEVADRFDPLPFVVLDGGAVDLSALCASSRENASVFDSAGEPREAGLPLYRYPRKGVWTSRPLDSEIARCVWHRVVFEGTLPRGTRVSVLTWTAESDEPPELLAMRPLEEWRLAGVWSNQDEVEVEGETDFLVRSPPGRFLWLELVFESGGEASPRLSSAEVEFPRISLRRYLPAIFGAEPVARDFTDRWLAVFDRTFRDLEAVIDDQAGWFDPLSCPASPRGRDFLSWLAGWVGVALERNWPESRRRAYLKHGPRLFPWRGTVNGLRESLYLFLGLERWRDHEPGRAECVPCLDTTTSRWRPPRLVLEHFVLRRWMFLGAGRLSDNAKLWGERIVNRSRLSGPRESAELGGRSGARLGVSQLYTMQDPCRDPFHEYAHKLSVFVPAACVRDPSVHRALKRLVELERPAHVAPRVVAVEPRFRIGVQAMLGLDAVIGWRPQPVRLDEASLGRATVLESDVDASSRLRVGNTRVGETTVLP